MNTFIRQFHRWMSVAFVLTVITTSIALAQKAPIMWISYLPLLPLALLALTGLSLFVPPHAAKWRGEKPASRQET